MTLLELIVYTLLACVGLIVLICFGHCIVFILKTNFAETRKYLNAFPDKLKNYTEEYHSYWDDAILINLYDKNDPECLLSRYQIKITSDICGYTIYNDSINVIRVPYPFFNEGRKWLANLFEQKNERIRKQEMKEMRRFIETMKNN